MSKQVAAVAAYVGRATVFLWMREEYHSEKDEVLFTPKFYTKSLKEKKEKFEVTKYIVNLSTMNGFING